MSANLYIIPHDFTSVGDAALKYALFLAKPRNTDIQLIHVISNKSKIKIAEKELEKIIKNLDLSVGSVKITPKVVEGSIFDDIPKIAKKENARLIIMGTHGAKGMQKVFGSYAMKMVRNSSVPFLMVQDGVEHNKMENIVVPITTAKESLQAIHLAGEIAKTFDSSVHIIAKHESDSSFNQQTKIRVAIAEKLIEEKGLNKAEVKIIKKSSSFHKIIIEFAKENNCDLISVTHDSSNLLPQLDQQTQSLITNEADIPCLVVNAKFLASYSY